MVLRVNERSAANDAGGDKGGGGRDVTAGGIDSSFPVGKGVKAGTGTQTPSLLGVGGTMIVIHEQEVRGKRDLSELRDRKRQRK